MRLNATCRAVKAAVLIPRIMVHFLSSVDEGPDFGKDFGAEEWNRREI
jgi:hypothetical protein